MMQVLVLSAQATGGFITILLTPVVLSALVVLSVQVVLSEPVVLAAPELLAAPLVLAESENVIIYVFCRKLKTFVIHDVLSQI